MPEEVQLQSCIRGECFCGRGLFQSDKDLRDVRCIATNSGVYISSFIEHGELDAGDWVDRDDIDITREEMRVYLNGGVLEDQFFRLIDDPRLLVLFGAVAMQFGADISESHHGLLVANYKGHLDSQRQLDEYKLALWCYENGKPWDGFETGYDLDDYLRRATKRAREWVDRSTDQIVLGY